MSIPAPKADYCGVTNTQTSYWPNKQGKAVLDR